MVDPMLKYNQFLIGNKFKLFTKNTAAIFLKEIVNEVDLLDKIDLENSDVLSNQESSNEGFATLAKADIAKLIVVFDKLGGSKGLYIYSLPIKSKRSYLFKVQLRFKE